MVGASFGYDEYTPTVTNLSPSKFYGIHVSATREVDVKGSVQALEPCVGNWAIDGRLDSPGSVSIGDYLKALVDSVQIRTHMFGLWAYQHKSRCLNQFGAPTP